MGHFVGRHIEQEIFADALKSGESNLIAVVGRRRVGKTFMIRNLYSKLFVFDMVGLQNGSTENQLQIFIEKLAEYSKSKFPIEMPKDWLAAFNLLTKYLKSIKNKQKKILFFDEFPWISTHKSGFVEAFAHFWNSWASDSGFTIIICGSAASWMLDKVINNKGGLHNRITKIVNLKPFTLSETEEYLKSRNINLDRYQISLIYMVMGGIPHYLKEIKAGQTAAQNIDSICFSSQGLLKNEYTNLYAALFEHSENHTEIVETLAKSWKGFSRNEIIAHSKFTNGGGLSKLLDELETSSFITTYLPFGKKKKEKLYRLTDEYSLFYLQFIKPNVQSKSGTWLQLSQTQQWISWSGFAFENLCLKHINKIKDTLKISGIYTNESSFLFKGDEKNQGFQIDLLIERADKAVNLCEMKFYTSEFELTKEYAKKLRIRNELFKNVSKSKRQIFNTLITTFGLLHNENSLGIIDNTIVLNDLF